MPDLLIRPLRAIDLIITSAQVSVGVQLPIADLNLLHSLRSVPSRSPQDPKGLRAMV